MRLARVGEPGAEVPVVVDEGGYLDLRSITPDITPEFLGADGIRRAAAAVRSGELPEIEVPADARLGAPISRASTIITIATNYYAHAAEAGRPIPTEPVVVFKAASSLSGPHDPVLLPQGSTRLDWEAELGIVIGAPCFLLADDADATAHIAGYVASNDVADRDRQFVDSGNQWGKGKSYPTFTPLGPWLVTPDEVQADDAAIRTLVNGEVRQHSSTADMIFSAAQLVRYLSQHMRLESGDVILTGTPQGVALSGAFPYLSEDDVIEIEIAGLGKQRTPITSTL